MILSISNLRSIPQAVSFDTAARKSVSVDSFEKVTGSGGWPHRSSNAKAQGAAPGKCASSSCAKDAPAAMQQQGAVQQQNLPAKAGAVQQSASQDRFPAKEQGAKGGYEQGAKEPVEI